MRPRAGVRGPQCGGAAAVGPSGRCRDSELAGGENRGIHRPTEALRAVGMRAQAMTAAKPGAVAGKREDEGGCRPRGARAGVRHLRPAAWVKVVRVQAFPAWPDALKAVGV